MPEINADDLEEQAEQFAEHLDELKRNSIMQVADLQAKVELLEELDDDSYDISELDSVPGSPEEMQQLAMQFKMIYQRID